MANLRYCRRRFYTWRSIIWAENYPDETTLRKVIAGYKKKLAHALMATRNFKRRYLETTFSSLYNVF